MQAFPKEVYGWYKSASLHTGKRRIPARLWLLLLCLVLLPVVIFFAVSHLPGKSGADAAKGQATPSKAPSSFAPGSEVSRHLTVDQWISLRKSRLKDFPHTAPVYDEVTKPVVAPYPAACIRGESRCLCYTQQGTLMPFVSKNVCNDIVEHGIFIDWQSPVQPAPSPVVQQPMVQQPVAPQQGQVHPVSPPLPLESHAPSLLDDGWIQRLAARNAAVHASQSH
jgi:zona occludens toxin